MGNKPNPVVRYFLIFAMGIGLVIVFLGTVEDVRDFIPQSLTTFEFAQFDVDPTSGQIIGNIILGKPDRSGIISSLDDECNSFEAISLGTQLPLSFGITRSPTKCYYGFSEWDISAIPDNFKYTRVDLTVKPQKFFPNLPVGSGSAVCRIGLLFQPIDTIPTGQLIGKMSGVGQGDARSSPATTHALISDGAWCGTDSESSFFIRPNLDGRGRDISPASAEITRSITGDNKITLFIRFSQAFFPNSGCCWEQDQLFWEQAGAIKFSGSAPPIVCGSGTELVGFSCQPLNCTAGFVAGGAGGNECIPIFCESGTEIDLESNTCKVIECNVGETLVNNLCEPIICQTGMVLQGNSCEQVICETGFDLIGSTCVLKTCSTGFELVGDSCLEITCPLGTTLQANDCNPITCPTGSILSANTCEQITCDSDSILVGNICKPLECQLGEILVDSVCQQITCETGQILVASECTTINCLATEELVGDTCQPRPLNCPSGTFESNNVCVQFVPQLLATGAPPDFLTLTGLLIFGIAFTGFIVRAVRNRAI